MDTHSNISVDLLHDLAYLFFGLAHGADEHLDTEELRTIAIKLRQWQPHKNPALIEHAVREAHMSYLNHSDQDHLMQAVDTLGKALPHHLRLTVLRDLSEIAKADGIVKSGEINFIDHITAQWGMDYEEKPS